LQPRHAQVTGDLQRRLSVEDMLQIPLDQSFRVAAAACGSMKYLLVEDTAGIDRERTLQNMTSQQHIDKTYINIDTKNKSISEVPSYPGRVLRFQQPPPAQGRLRQGTK